MTQLCSQIKYLPADTEVKVSPLGSAGFSQNRADVNQRNRPGGEGPEHLQGFWVTSKRLKVLYLKMSYYQIEETLLSTGDHWAPVVLIQFVLQSTELLVQNYPEENPCRPKNYLNFQSKLCSIFY